MKIYDILPEFGSYIVDVETNLEMDKDEWNRYLNDKQFEAAIITDILLDFGLWQNIDIPNSEYRTFAQTAAHEYVGLV